MAEIVLEATHIVNWAACFHAQQATEKALKAVLALHGIDFPRSHALERLLALVSTGTASTFDGESVAELTPWAVAGRYPEDIPSPDKATTRRLIAVARKVIDNAAALIAQLDI